jgi:hypothetical protein
MHFMNQQTGRELKEIFAEIKSPAFEVSYSQ